MNEYRYSLEKKGKNHHCPECTQKRFIRYVDAETGQYLPEQYGRCSRESKCSYHLNPYTDGHAKMIWEQTKGNNPKWKPKKYKPTPKPIKPIAFIPFDILRQTLSGYEQNTFIQNLIRRVAFPFEVQDIEKVISLYHLGTVQNGYRKGANTFPFIDIQGNIRAVQVKQFDQQNHTTGTDFLHSIIEKHHTRKNKPLPEWLEAYNKNETKVSCLFGEHLLSKYPHNPVALVEAPKTAIYGTLYFGCPEQPTTLLWLAVYNLSSLNLNKCKALKCRNVYLFPDLSKDGKAYDKWKADSEAIQRQLQDTYFHVSDLLEQLAPKQDKEEGKDIADYLIKLDWRQFRQKETKQEPQRCPIKQPKVETLKSEKSEKGEAQTKTFFSQPEPLSKVEKLTNANIQNFTKLNLEQRQNWCNDIEELENYFRSIELPTQPVKINRCSTIEDCSLFIESHFATVKRNNGNSTFLPYLKRLQELKHYTK